MNEFFIWDKVKVGEEILTIGIGSETRLLQGDIETVWNRQSDLVRLFLQKKQNVK